MTAYGFALFETAIGRCGIAWGERGVASVALPEVRDADTRARMLRRFPGAQELPPSPDVQRAVDAIVALLRGEAADLADIPLDMNGVSPFYRRVYEVARTIGPGATLSYGEVATRLGSPGSARAVGQALGRNPFPIVVPCHRVLAAGGKMGGFSANGGITTKLRLLTIEGARHAGADSFDAEAAMEHLRTKDARLGRLFDKVGPFRMRVNETPSIFLALAESIVYQQLTTKAAATIFARVCALFPHAAEGFAPEHVLRVSDEKLRGAGLSRAKLLALRDLAQRAKDGQLPTLDDVRGMSDEAIIEHLTEVRGIGRWTVEMLLIFRLGRPDVLPVDDYGIRKGFMLAFGKREMPERKALETYGNRWKPYRSVASWYLWRALEATWP
ncbi:methylated-DNA--[protein]-cysteine S-methyltransferase [Pendulispora rubella]|uniref:DNA-3-methyladenine glycosylase II n=1 Tax=Pendulispora rubella TaxID=2741070 RepID=A0ABZ2L7Z1_9BACT